jgi:hypothetical protein
MATALFAATGAALALTYGAALAWNARLYVVSAGVAKAGAVHLLRSLVLLGALLGLALGCYGAWRHIAGQRDDAPGLADVKRRGTRDER